MYSAFDRWAYLSHMLTVISMFSPCTQWVFGPLSPVSALSVSPSSSFPPSISLFSFPSALSLPPVPLSVCNSTPVSCLISIFPPCASVSSVFPSAAHSAKICPDSSVMHENRFDAVQLSPLDRPPEDPPPDVAGELRDWFQAYVGLGVAEPALPTASDPLPTSNNSGDFPDFLAPTNEFEDPLPFANTVENSPFCSYDLCNTFPAPRSNDERGLQSLGSLSSAIPCSASSDNSRPTPGYDRESSLPAASLEIDMPSLCFQGSPNVVRGFRSDPEFPSRVSTLGPTLGSSSPRPLHEISILDGELGYTMRVSTGILRPTDSKPADEYNAQSEPEPPDPSCASH